MKLFRKNKASSPGGTRRSSPSDSAQKSKYNYYSQRTSAPSASGNSPRGDARSSNSTNRIKLRLGYFPSMIALLAMISVLLYSLWLQPNPRLTVLNTPGTVYRDTGLYHEQISAIWSKSIYNQTKLTVKSSDIKAAIIAEFGELADVEIELPLLGRRPFVTIKPAMPAFQLVSGSNLYFVSSKGRVMASTKDVIQNDLGDLPLVRDEGGLSAEVGKIVLPENQANYIKNLFAQLTSAGTTVLSITLPSDAANQAVVRVQGEAYYIKFAIEGDPRQAVGSFIAVSKKLKSNGITPNEYIDVRVGEKVFYK